MLSFDKGVTRSLRVGREFRRRSRQRQQDLARQSARVMASRGEMPGAVGGDVDVTRPEVELGHD